MKMKLTIQAIPKKKHGKYYIIKGKVEGTPSTLIFGRFRNKTDIQNKIEELVKKYDITAIEWRD
jgi:hypothetical protein